METWDELNREKVFDQYGRSVFRVTYRLPSGTEQDFYIRHEPRQGAVVALTKEQKVILVRQYRPGPKEILLELPGGFFDEGEEPEEGVRREFREETGYQGKIVSVGQCWNDAYSDYEKFAFVATDCEKVDTVTEDLETVLVTLSEFRDLIRQGRLTDTELAYMGLDYLGLL
jgi:ADP-ribose pyrophosphatase